MLGPVCRSQLQLMKGRVMTSRATGAFRVKLSPQVPEERSEGSTLEVGKVQGAR